MEFSILILLYLIIGHLVGDFLLQTSSLVSYKQKSIYGIFLHSSIVLGSQTLFLAPYLDSLKISLSLILIGVLHFVIDYTKIKLKLFTKYPIIPFTLDQIAHFSVLFLAYLIIQKETPLLFVENWWFQPLYQNTPLLAYSAGVIFFSYTLDIVYLTFKLQKNPNYKYTRGYFDMLMRVSIFALIYILYSVYFT